MLQSRRPVVAICAVRTGCGKSQTTRRVAGILRQAGLRVAAVRHPMPYGDLEKQRVQRFGSVSDLSRHHCTIEEIEEYEPHIVTGTVVFAGVDYAAILEAAEREADVILWDGGNNDLPFYRPDLHIVVTDPLRVGHELSYYPGEANLRMAHVALINKVDTADAASVDGLRANIRAVNPGAIVVEAASPLFADYPDRITGQRVLVVEDGPTLTHGEMAIRRCLYSDGEAAHLIYEDRRTGRPVSLFVLPHARQGAPELAIMGHDTVHVVGQRPHLRGGRRPARCRPASRSGLPSRPRALTAGHASLESNR